MIVQFEGTKEKAKNIFSAELEAELVSEQAWAKHYKERAEQLKSAFESCNRARQAAESQNDRYRVALEEIASYSQQGEECGCMNIARKALDDV